MLGHVIGINHCINVAIKVITSGGHIRNSKVMFPFLSSRRVFQEKVYRTSLINFHSTNYLVIMHKILTSDDVLPW